jgi:Family of unknown function (DUF6526)
MPEQNYRSHRRYVPMYHFVLSFALLAGLGGSLVNLYHSMEHPQTHYSAALITWIFLALLPMFFLLRVFALKAQDRAIRAEENLRHFALTGKLLDPRLSTRQIVGLRFAADGEFVELAKRAATEGLSEDQIKREIKNWKADTYRV